MATSQQGSLNIHDWKRVLEVFVQGLLALGVPYLITFIPQLDLGRFTPLGVVAVLILTEIGKRLAQGPSR